MGSKVVVTRSKLDLLADSVSAKSGESLPLTIGEMKVAVDGIVLNSTIIGDGELNVDENDYLYFEDDGSDGFIINDTMNETGITAVITGGSAGRIHSQETFYQKFYPDQTYTSGNKLPLQLEPSENCMIFVHTTQYPTAPETGYKALFWNYSIYRYDSSHAVSKIEHAILRANGTEGTDSSQCSFNPTTGVLQLGGSYGYFFPEDEYEVIQIVMT